MKKILPTSRIGVLPVYTTDGWKDKLSLLPSDKDELDSLPVLQGHTAILNLKEGRIETSTEIPITTPHGAIKLLNGDLGFIGNSTTNKEFAKIKYYISSDLGRSWQERFEFPSIINEEGKCFSFLDAQNREIRLCEPHIGQLNSGELISFFRILADLESHEYVLYFSKSDSSGLSWSAPIPTEFPGYPPHLLKLADGSFILTYAQRWGNFGIYGCRIDSNGEWEGNRPFLIEPTLTDEDHGYPSSVEIDEVKGLILTSFYEYADGQSKENQISGIFWNRFGEAILSSKR